MHKNRTLAGNFMICGARAADEVWAKSHGANRAGSLENRTNSQVLCESEQFDRECCRIVSFAFPRSYTPVPREAADRR